MAMVLPLPVVPQMKKFFVASLVGRFRIAQKIFSSLNEIAAGDSAGRCEAPSGGSERVKKLAKSSGGSAGFGDSEKLVMPKRDLIPSVWRYFRVVLSARFGEMTVDSGGGTFLQRGSPTPTSLASVARIVCCLCEWLPKWRLEQGLLSGLSLNLIVDPGICSSGYAGEEGQIVAPERSGRFPFLAVLVKAGEGGVVETAVARFVVPDCGFDRAEADFVDGFWFVFHG